jgi:hypothetical protein
VLAARPGNIRPSSAVGGRDSVAEGDPGAESSSLPSRRRGSTVPAGPDPSGDTIAALSAAGDGVDAPMPVLLSHTTVSPDSPLCPPSVELHLTLRADTIRAQKHMFSSTSRPFLEVYRLVAARAQCVPEDWRAITALVTHSGNGAFSFGKEWTQYVAASVNGDPAAAAAAAASAAASASASASAVSAKGAGRRIAAVAAVAGIRLNDGFTLPCADAAQLGECPAAEHFIATNIALTNTHDTGDNGGGSSGMAAAAAIVDTLDELWERVYVQAPLGEVESRAGASLLLPTLRMTAGSLCAGEVDRPLLLRLMAHRGSTTAPELIGQARTTMRRLAFWPAARPDAALPPATAAAVAAIPRRFYDAAAYARGDASAGGVRIEDHLDFIVLTGQANGKTGGALTICRSRVVTAVYPEPADRTHALAAASGLLHVDAGGAGPFSESAPPSCARAGSAQDSEPSRNSISAAGSRPSTTRATRQSLFSANAPGAAASGSFAGALAAGGGAVLQAMDKYLAPFTVLPRLDLLLHLPLSASLVRSAWRSKPYIEIYALDKGSSASRASTFASAAAAGSGVASSGASAANAAGSEQIPLSPRSFKSRHMSTADGDDDDLLDGSFAASAAALGSPSSAAVLGAGAKGSSSNALAPAHGSTPTAAERAAAEATARDLRARRGQWHLGGGQDWTPGRPLTMEGHFWRLLYRTETAGGSGHTTEPTWQAAVLPLAALCSSLPSRAVLIRVCHDDGTRDGEFIGRCVTSLRKLFPSIYSSEKKSSKFKDKHSQAEKAEKPEKKSKNAAAAAAAALAKENEPLVLAIIDPKLQGSDKDYKNSGVLTVRRPRLLVPIDCTTVNNSE